MHCDKIWWSQGLNLVSRNGVWELYDVHQFQFFWRGIKSSWWSKDLDLRIWWYLCNYQTRSRYGAHFPWQIVDTISIQDVIKIHKKNCRIWSFSLRNYNDKEKGRKNSKSPRWCRTISEASLRSIHCEKPKTEEL